MAPGTAENGKPVPNHSKSTILHNLVRMSPTEKCATESNNPPHPWRWIRWHRAMESGNALQVTITTLVTTKILGQLTGIRRLATIQMGIPLTPLMNTLQRHFKVKCNFRIHKGLGASAGAQMMISIEHTLLIEHLKVLPNQVPKRSACLAIAPRLDA